MWTYEHEQETDAAPEAIWELWANVDGWGLWNPGIESVAIDGPFESGSVITMVPPGEEAVRLRLTEVVTGRSFVDEASFGGVLIRTEHHLEQSPGGRRRVVYRLSVTGPQAETLGPVVGPQITADFPDTVASLIAHAER